MPTSLDALDLAAERSAPPSPGCAADGATTAHGRARWRWAALAAGLATTGLRLWTVRNRFEYSLWPDEPAQLAIARFVGGGTHWTMHNHSVWRPAYGSLLGPVYALTDHPEHVYRAATTLNAMLGGVAAALLVLLARRLTGLGPRAALFAAVAVAATPALLFTGTLVWAESLVAPVYLATVLAMLRFVEAPSAHRGVTLAVLCGAGLATHSRLLPLAGVAVVLVAAAVRRRALAGRHAASVLATLAAALAAAEGYTRFVVARLWEHPADNNSVGGVLRQLSDPGAVVVAAVGQVWYLVAGSAGLVAIAAAHVARRARRDPACAVLALVVVAQVLLSAVFMSGRVRPDQIVYGRYNDVVVAPLVLVGLAAVGGPVGARWRLRRVLAGLAASAGFLVVAAALVWTVRAGPLSEGNGLEPMIFAIQPFVDGRPSLPLLRISVVAMLAIAVLAAGVVVGRALGTAVPVAVVVAGLLVTGAARTDHVMARAWPGSGDLRAVGRLDDIGGPLAGGAPVDYYLPPGSDATGRLMLYQWYLPDSLITVVDDPLTEVSSRFVFAPSRTPELLRSGAFVVWHDPLARVALWRRV